MKERIISPASMYYFGTVVHLFVFLIIGFMFSFVFDSPEIVPKLIIGAFFLAITLLITFHVNRQVYIRVVDDETVDLRSMLRQVVLPLKDVQDIRRVWINTYVFRANGKTYAFLAFKDEVEYLKDVVKKAKSEHA